MAQGDVHVVPREGQWEIQEEGGGSPLSTFPTQDQAWQQGQQLARERSAEALLHGEDGQIRERNTYGNDPRDIPG